MAEAYYAVCGGDGEECEVHRAWPGAAQAATASAAGVAVRRFADQAAASACSAAHAWYSRSTACSSCCSSSGGRYA